MYIYTHRVIPGRTRSVSVAIIAMKMAFAKRTALAVSQTNGNENSVSYHILEDFCSLEYFGLKETYSGVHAVTDIHLYIQNIYAVSYNEQKPYKMLLISNMI